MTWTDGKPFEMTEEILRSFLRKRCSLCGSRFKVGDTCRWQYTNDLKHGVGNPMVCRRCDGTKSEIAAKLQIMRNEHARLGGILKGR